MHQHPHQQAFAPTRHQSLTLLPAPMGPQDSNFNTHLPRGATGPSFAPVTAFHRATQKSFRSTKRGRWGALHVCIAWKIYYHEQLKKIQQKSNNLHRVRTPEHPATSPPDSVQHEESEQPSSMHPNLDSPHSRKTAENVRHFNRSHPCDLRTSAPASCHRHATKRDTREQPLNLQWKEKLAEKEKHGRQQTDTGKDLPLRDTSWDRTPELGDRRSRSLDRKRPHDCDSFIKVKKVKREIVDEHFDSSKTLHTDPPPFGIPHAHPSSHTVPVQHINRTDSSVLYTNSSRCNFTRAPGTLISYPGAEMHPYQTALLEPTWGIHKRMDLLPRQNVLKDFSLNTCKANRIPFAAQWQKEAFHGFFAPPLQLPLALRQQETVYHRGREFLDSRPENHHNHRYRHQVPHPGFLATSYLGP